MSSTIVHQIAVETDASGEDTSDGNEKHPFLLALGERVRALRTRKGMTRKALAAAADVSERHLANLEYGVGNASILVLLHVSQALGCPLTELLSNGPHDNAATAAGQPASMRIALVGLRGAGKSTLGSMLAEDLGVPFIELSREIEKLAGCSISEILALYGQNAYRRYERRALEQAIQSGSAAVIATPGGIVADSVAFNLLLAQCTTVWLQAAPQDHMKRVIAQGDTRPMAASREAMDDLKTILAGRTPFYAKAALHIDTSAQPIDRTFETLREKVRAVLKLPG
jgi:XRE family transcriptional regulator, aerobic/anaerobic benzoate catabolism transcriptional regulator